MGKGERSDRAGIFQVEQKGGTFNRSLRDGVISIITGTLPVRGGES